MQAFLPRLISLSRHDIPLLLHIYMYVCECVVSVSGRPQPVKAALIEHDFLLHYNDNKEYGNFRRLTTLGKKVASVK